MKSPRRQGGATLLVTLIMLIMLTLFAVSAMNTSTTNLQVVGNMQSRAESLEATRAAIETTISSPQFIQSPANAIPNPCGGPNTLCTDSNGDGTPDFTTRLTPNPRCVEARIIKVNELRITGPTSNDVACLQAQQQGQFAVAGAQSSGDSLCGQTVWEIVAVTTKPDVANSDLRYGLTQGVGVRIPALDVASSC